MLVLEKAEAPANLRLAGHGHAAPHLMVVAEGGLMEAGTKRDHDLARGSFRLSRAGAPHNLHFGSSGATCLIFEAEGPFWRRVFERALAKAEGDVFGAAPEFANLNGSVDVMQLMRTPAYVTALGRVLATAASRRPLDREPAWMEEAVALIEDGNDRAIAHVAEMLRRDRIHLTRAFGQWLGFRPAEYRALRRAAAALDLIRTTGAPFAEIALECGYAHQSHMNNALRSLYGHPPSHWRR